MQQIIRENASTIVTQFMTVGGQALEKLQTYLYVQLSAPAGGNAKTCRSASVICSKIQSMKSQAQALAKVNELHGCMYHEGRLAFTVQFI